MEIVKPSVELVNPPDYETILNTVELAARNCYQSFDKMCDGSAEGIIRALIKSGHEAIIEFADITVMFTTDRAVLAQLTRHRIGTSFAVQSQRYVNYSKEKFGENIKVIVPEGLSDEAYETWRASVLASEAAYMVLTKDKGMPAEVARSVLPNCTATTICMKANIREWRHIFELRVSKHSQTDIRKLMKELLIKMYEEYPVFFEDLYNKVVQQGTLD